MVNLPTPEEQAVRRAQERGRAPFQGVRSHRQWGAHWGRQREEMKARLWNSNLTLSQIEYQVSRCLRMMESNVPISNPYYQKFMRLLREEHNLNFAFVGNMSTESHDCDELVAPQR